MVARNLGRIADDPNVEIVRQDHLQAFFKGKNATVLICGLGERGQTDHRPERQRQECFGVHCCNRLNWSRACFLASPLALYSLLAVTLAIGMAKTAPTE